MEPVSLLTIFDKTLKVVGLVRDGNRRRDEKTDQALFALYTALSETRAYVHDLNQGKRRNRQRELKLADLWHKASIPIRYIDRDLARRCFYKGSYWLEPSTWTEAKVRRSGIALDTVHDKVKGVLLNR